MSGPYYGYTSWNYGYTLCPETGSQYYRPPVGAAQGYVPRGRGGGRGNHFSRGGGRGGYNNQYEKRPEPAQPVKVETPVVVAQAVEVKNEAAVVAANPPEKKEEKEDGEIIERSLEEILQGRNAVMFCNDQSKTVILSFCQTKLILEYAEPLKKTLICSINSICDYSCKN